jgi:glycine/D-amino acid oxidase-like deaminating enzyme
MPEVTTPASSIEYLDDTGWVERPEATVPPLPGEINCDVAVVGGGLMGMAAALRLAERGADVVLLEADLCGWGASSRNAGYVTNTLAADADVLGAFYRNQLPGLLRFADSAVRFTEALLGRLDIACEYERTAIIGAAVTPGQLKRAQRMAKTLGSAGWHADLIAGSDLGLPDAFLGGVRERIGGLLNPGKYALGVRAALLASRARVYEQTLVQAIDADDTGATLRTAGGQVRAERVLLATNAYSRNLKAAPRRLAAPLWVTLVETDPVVPERLEEIGWVGRSGIVTLHTLLENYRPTAQNTIVLGTRRVQTSRGYVHGRRPDASIVAELVRGFHERFPALSDVVPRRAWGGWIAVTPSWLPAAGEASPRVSYGIGCNGHGLAQAPYLGTLLANRLAGDEPHDDLRAVWRERPRFAPGVLSSAPAVRAAWLLDRLADRRQRRRTRPTTQGDRICTTT